MSDEKRYEVALIVDDKLRGGNTIVVKRIETCECCNRSRETGFRSVTFPLNYDHLFDRKPASKEEIIAGLRELANAVEGKL
jgi:hypothetical protein